MLTLTVSILAFFFGALGETRTHDLLIRSQSLYPAELRAHIGGEQGIRTLDTGFCPYTRLAGERLRPTRPTLQFIRVLAEGVGFEPTEPLQAQRFSRPPP